MVADNEYYVKLFFETVKKSVYISIYTQKIIKYAMLETLTFSDSSVILILRNCRLNVAITTSAEA